jgi:hypothetical protein
VNDPPGGIHASSDSNVGSAFPIFAENMDSCLIVLTMIRVGTTTMVPWTKRMRLAAERSQTTPAIALKSNSYMIKIVGGLPMSVGLSDKILFTLVHSMIVLYSPGFPDAVFESSHSWSSLYSNLFSYSLMYGTIVVFISVVAFSCM